MGQVLGWVGAGACKGGARVGLRGEGDSGHRVRTQVWVQAGYGYGYRYRYR